MNTLSVFFPCINEEGNIENTVSSAQDILKKLNIEYEIIIVDDGSVDSTGKIADRLAKENSKIRVIHHPKNLGYGEALKSGFYNARYDTVVYTDGDGQFDFAEVTKFLEKMKDHDLVIGYRIKRKDSFLRKLFGRGWRLTLLAFFRLTLKDVDCGFKMVSKKVLEKISHLTSSRGAMINAELAIKAKKAGFKIGQVGVNHYPRLSGRPTGANLKVIIKSYLDLIKLWWELKNDKLIFILLLGVLALAAFLRFYKLPQYMTFLGDEGRDAILIKRMVTKYDFPLIGPPMSVGNIYLGPLYYYIIAPAMAVSNFNPVSAAATAVFIGTATVFLIYYTGKIWFDKKAGLAAAFLYAVSPVTIIYSRSSWNPNPAPFFALLSILGIYKASESRNFKWLVLTGFGAAAAIQMHYLALILLPVLGFLWLSVLFSKETKKHFWRGTGFGLLAFFFVMLPLLVFDLKHDFLNYRALSVLSGSGNIAGDLSGLMKIPSLFSYNLISRYMAGENLYLTIISAILIISALFYKPFSRPKIILSVWLIIGLIGLSFIEKDIYDHYFGFMNPVPYLLFGSVLGGLFKKRILMVFFWGLILSLAVVNLQKNPLMHPANNQLERTQEIAKFVINQTQNRPFNFALLAENNYDSAYQFYLDMYGHKPKEVPSEKTDQLFVVCEDEVCNPAYSPKYELAAYGMSKVEWQKDVFGVKIYKLIPNPTGKP